MKHALLLIAISSFAFAAPTVRLSGDPTAQQAIFVIDGLTGTTAQCTAVVYLDSALTVKSNDTNEAIFTGSEACPRPYNIVEGKRIYAVFGRRTSEVSSAGLLVSRSLQTATPHWLQVCDTAASSCTAGIPFTTDNIRWGATHIELPPINAAGFSRRAYEDLDWSPAGLNKLYIDPMTGVGFKRVARNMMGKGGDDSNSPMQEYTFLDVFDLNSAWTNPNNAKNTSTSGPFATYASTTRDPLYLPFRSDTPASWYRVGNNLQDRGIVVYGSAVDTGNVEDRKILLCLPIDYVPATNTCGSAEIDATLPTSAGSVGVPSSYPTYRFAGWSFNRQPSREQAADVGGSSATVSSSVVTINQGGNGLKGDVLPVNLAPGKLFKIGSTSYHVGTLGTATSFTLAESGINTSGAWSVEDFGVRIRKKTTTNNQISVALTYREAYDTVPDPGANAVPDFCSQLTSDVDREADGTTVLSPTKKGRICFVGTKNKYLILLLEDGETRYLSDVDHYDQNCGGVPTNTPTGAWSVSNPLGFYATHMGDSSCNWSLFEVSYHPETCHWAANPGNKFHTVSKVDDCLTWVDKTPRMSGLSIQQQLAAPAAANLIWDPSFNTGGFTFTGISGPHAIFNYFTEGQDGPCIVATFSLTTFLFESLFDSVSGALPGLRFATCHSNGANLTNRAGAASFGYLIAGGKNNGYVGGPWLLQPPSAKSLDGGATWLSDTSLTNTQAGTCIGGGAGVAGLVQCVKLKLPSPTPCNKTAESLDAGKWPCAWHSGWSAPIPSIVAGDWFSWLDSFGNVNGKAESIKILSIVPDPGLPGGSIIEALRFSICQDRQFFNHLTDGTGGYEPPNGWTPVLVPANGCGGSIAWMDFSVALASRSLQVDNSNITASHDSIGSAADHVRSTQVGPGNARTGTLPASAGGPIDHTFAINDTTFNGLHANSGTNVEQYASVGNWACYSSLSCSNYWDFRALNPDLGTIPEDFVSDWGQTYTAVSGQKYTWKITPKDSFGDFKSRPVNVFGARATLLDVSGPGSTIDDSKPWTYCQAYKAGECRSGSSVGDLWASVPNAHIAYGGCGTDATWAYTPCAVPLWSNAGWMIEQSSQRDDPSGSQFRRITMGQSGPASHFQYSTPHMVPDTKWAFVRSGVPNGISDLPILIKMPPPSMPDSIARDTFIKMPLTFPAGSGYVLVRFGYAENEPDSSHPYYCTSRQEECVTDSAISPFAFASAFPSTSGSSDTLTATNCTSGCTVNVPLLSGRVATYRVEKSPNGSTGWVAGVPQVVAVK